MANDIRLSQEKLLQVLQQAGNTAVIAYSLFVAWTFAEILDPSDTSKRLGIVRLGDKETPLYIVSDKMMAEAANNVLSEDAFARSRTALRASGHILTLKKQHGQYILVRDSEKNGWGGYTAHTAFPRYSWVFDIPELAAFDPRDSETRKNCEPDTDSNAGSQERENCEPQEKNREPRLKNREPKGKNREPETPNPIETQVHLPLGFNQGLNKKERGENDEPSPSFSKHGQDDQTEFESLGRELAEARTQVQNICARFNSPHPNRTKKQANALVIQLVSLATAAGCPGASDKNNARVSDVILEHQGYEDEVWIHATRTMISDAQALDEGKPFHIGHVCSRMTETLPAHLEKSKKAVKDSFLSPHRQTMARCEDRRRVIVELADADRKQAEEQALVEDHLCL